MTGAEREYWSAIVQLAPLLGLSLVIEARALSKRWDARTPQFQRTTHSLMWFVGLVAVTAALFAGLGALRQNDEPGYIARWLTALALSFSVGILLLGPVLTLLQSVHARPLGRALARSRQMSRVVRQMERNAARIAMANTRRRAATFTVLAKCTQTAARHSEVIDLLRRMPRPLTKDVAELEANAHGISVEVEAQCREARLDFRAAVVEELNWRTYWAASRRQIAEWVDLALRGRAQLWEEYFRNMEGNLALGNPIHLYVAAEPDDGGFYADDEPFELLSYESRPYLVRNASEFESRPPRPSVPEC